MLTRIPTVLSRLRQRQEATDNKFGTFAGVFTPTVLTILGAIMYLRLGQVVGNAGLVGSLIIIVLAHIITICTGLAVSSIVTNTRVGAGGAFAIIAKSLGIEVGGAVGVPLYLAQGISVALYILAFSEGWIRIFPTHPALWVAIIAYFIVFAVAFISTQFAFRVQYVILAIVAFSLFSVLLASFPMAGRPGFTQTPVLWGDFPTWNFWETFAIFFPAVTGIMAGISMSGTLRDARESIPKGTMSAIGITMIIYLLLVYWLTRVGSPEELVQNATIMVDKAFWGWAILAGILGATFSSALGSIVAAPRVMQALAMNRLVPFANLFVQETAAGEPRPAMLATGSIGFVVLLLAIAGGGLNAVASVITMFFLITYCMLNVVVLIEQMLNMLSFRPLFSVPRYVPLIGLIGCLFVMFLIDPVFSLVAIVLVLAFYFFLARSKLQGDGNDVRSGLFITLAGWAANKASHMPSAPERAWKPSLLVPLDKVSTLTGSYRFLWALTAPQGAVHAVGIYPPGQEQQLKGLEQLADGLAQDGIQTHVTFLEDAQFVQGVRGATQVLRRIFFRPNLLFLTLRPDSDLAELQALVEKTAAYEMGMVILARHPIIELGREQLLNLWVSFYPTWQEQTNITNMHLAILLTYQLARNWEGQITICTAVATEAEQAQAQVFVQEVISIARLPKGTKRWVVVAPFEEALQHAPDADINILGLPPQVDFVALQRQVALIDTSCVFVRNSGEESALA